MNTYKTNVYIDGFNFYHSIEKQINDGICRYPSLQILCGNILNSIKERNHDLAEIHYFTALVESTKDDPGKLDRQKEYNSALKEEDVEIHYGKFVWSERLKKHVEKRSDVNLAVHVLNDAWLNKYDCAVIISGDADYLQAIRLVKKPFPGKPSKMVEVWAVGEIANDLKGAADKCRVITDTDLVRAKQIANHG